MTVRTVPRWINPYGVDDIICTAVTHGEYYGTPLGDASVTELIKPPQMVLLERAHAHELQGNVSDRLWSLQGQSVHEVLRRASERITGAITEERLSFEILGWTVSGKADCYRDAVPDGAEWDDETECWLPIFKGPRRSGLADYKLTSVWAFLHAVKPDWEKQLNSYTYGWRHAGFPVERLVVQALLRDWMASRAAEAYDNPDDFYPPSPFIRQDVDLWPIDRGIGYLENRVRLHQRAREHQEVPPCSPEEQWRGGDKWKVVKHGNKKATAVFGPDTKRGGGEAEAQGFCNALRGQHPKDAYIVKREEGVPMRCMRYCDVGGLRDFCPQWVRERGPYMAQTIRLNLMAEAA